VKHAEDLRWHKNLTAADLVDQYENVGFQSVNVARAAEAITRMYRADAKIFLTFTSNMVTSGLRGFFAQLIELGIVDGVVTTVGGLEEDIMKASGEKFSIGRFTEDDVELYENGINRVGNLLVQNESYMKFEDKMKPLLTKAYEKKNRWTPSDLFEFIGETLTDKHSILYQAQKQDVPVFCPAITDGSFGFHLYLFQQNHDDFVIDVVKDFKNIVQTTTHEDKKGVIALGGSISKHHALLACLLNGGIDYAVYMTTAKSTSGSMSGATTKEAKSWGKIKDDSDAATVHGDVSITFPLVMSKVLQTLHREGHIE